MRSCPGPFGAATCEGDEGGLSPSARRASRRPCRLTRGSRQSSADHSGPPETSIRRSPSYPAKECHDQHHLDQRRLAAATQTREAIEKSVEVFKNTAKTFTDQLDQFKLPTVDLTEPVARYFEYVQKAVDLNRDLATKWAELVTNLSGSFREQAEKVADIVKDQTNTVADLTVKQAEKAEQAARDQADQVEQAKREQEQEAEEAEKAKAREAKRIEREEAQKAQQKAREAYEGLTKAELSDQLAERGLPKTGNIDDLIERLVSADSE